MSRSNFVQRKALQQALLRLVKGGGHTRADLFASLGNVQRAWQNRMLRVLLDAKLIERTGPHPRPIYSALAIALLGEMIKDPIKMAGLMQQARQLYPSDGRGVPDNAMPAKDALVIRGKQRGFVTYDEINEAMPEDVVWTDQIDAWLAMLSDHGIEVVDDNDPRVVDPSPPPSTSQDTLLGLSPELPGLPSMVAEIQTALLNATLGVAQGLVDIKAQIEEMRKQLNTLGDGVSMLMDAMTAPQTREVTGGTSS